MLSFDEHSEGSRFRNSCIRFVGLLPAFKIPALDEELGEPAFAEIGAPIAPRGRASMSMSRRPDEHHRNFRWHAPCALRARHRRTGSGSTPHEHGAVLTPLATP